MKDVWVPSRKGESQPRIEEICKLRIDEVVAKRWIGDDQVKTSTADIWQVARRSAHYCCCLRDYGVARCDFRTPGRIALKVRFPRISAPFQCGGNFLDAGRPIASTEIWKHTILDNQLLRDIIVVGEVRFELVRLLVPESEHTLIS